MIGTLVRVKPPGSRSGGFLHLPIPDHVVGIVIARPQRRLFVLLTSEASVIHANSMQLQTVSQALPTKG